MRKSIHTYLIAVLTIVLSLAAFVGTASAADVYSSTTVLEAHKKLGVDYKIIQTQTASKTIVISIHGGNIEVGANQIAQAVAVKGGYDYYGFIGLKGSGLHVTSTHFNDPIALRMVKASDKTLSIHGCVGSTQVTNVGGLDKTAVARVKTELAKAGFTVKTATGGLTGSGTNNICNKNSRGKGVQLEITRGLRDRLMKNQADLDRYVNALVKAMG